MSGYIKLIVGGALIGIFMICIIAFAVNFAVDNDSDISLADDSRYGSLNSSLMQGLTNLSEDAETSQEILFKTTLEPGDEHSSTGGQFKIGPFTAMSIAVSSFGVGFKSIFGPEFTFILITFVTMITFIIGYYTIKAWLGRSPD